MPVAVALLSLYYASIGVAIASMTSRRIIAGATIIGLFLVSSIVAAVMVDGETRQESDQVELSPPATVITEDGEVLYIPEGGVGDGEVLYLDREPKPAALSDLLTLPLVLRDLVFLGQVEDSHPLSGLANGGLYAVILYLVLVLAAFGTLFVRYDEVER